MNLQVACDLDEARGAGARCFGGAQRPGNEDVFTDEVGFCLFGSHSEPRFICGLGSGDNKTTMGSPMEAGAQRFLGYVTFYPLPVTKSRFSFELMQKLSI